MRVNRVVLLVVPPPTCTTSRDSLNSALYPTLQRFFILIFLFKYRTKQKPVCLVLQLLLM